MAFFYDVTAGFGWKLSLRLCSLAFFLCDTLTPPICILTCANYSSDWGCHASFYVDFIIGAFSFAVSPSYREFSTYAAAENGFLHLFILLFFSILQQRLGLLSLWRSFACYFILHSALYHFVCSIDFLLALSHFSIAKVGQASCCKGHTLGVFVCLEKVSKILGCSCTFVQIL